jgi:rhodanese-related sulfurtransferase
MFAFLTKLLDAGPVDGTTLLDPAGLRDRLGGEAPPLVIDVRTPPEFQAGHVAGAVNIPLAQVPARAPALAEEGRPIVVVCQHGGRARQGAGLLRGHGVREVSVLQGGTSAWQAQGFPTHRGS